MRSESQKLEITLATKITILRVLLTVPIVVLMSFGEFYISFALFIFASVTDFLDGYLARKMNEVTVLGKFIDQLADKILITSTLIAFMDIGFLGSWFVIVTVVRDIIVNGIRMIAAEKGIVIAADKLGKIKTVSQVVLIIVLFIHGIINLQTSLVSTILVWLSFLFTVISGINYTFRNIHVIKGAN
ncbi:MAG: CDP-diacylglycerol---glycerol-3-phosphate 3-phosphatidyltransferase [Thermotogaceae bacterium]|jgi:CDP-diacylglycerol--glycerol-3-phosphate 3-phosphatidyltransferase|nr:CDP-diacylglycerol---glycerol-3-phosphate 3-phosphatidyltransferase [Thermotogaceae bacterium]